MDEILFCFCFFPSFGGSNIEIISKLQINNAGILGTIVNVEERKKLSSDKASLTMLCRGLGLC